MSLNDRVGDIVPIREILSLSHTAGVAEILDAIRALQRQSNAFQRSAENWASAYESERTSRARAENPENWRVQFTGDEAYDDPTTTPLTHGNYVTIEGTGQTIFHYTPNHGA